MNLTLWIIVVLIIAIIGLIIVVKIHNDAIKGLEIKLDEVESRGDPAEILRDMADSYEAQRPMSYMKRHKE